MVFKDPVCVTDAVTFHGRRLVNEEISVPDDGEIHGEIAGLVPFVPILQRQRDL